MKFIYSAGGFAREFIRLVRYKYPDEKIHLVDDNAAEGALTYAQARDLSGGKADFIIGFANSRLRKQKTEQLIKDGFSIFSVSAPTSTIGDNVIFSGGGNIERLLYNYL